jgi:hypothetical protein
MRLRRDPTSLSSVRSSRPSHTWKRPMKHVPSWLRPRRRQRGRRRTRQRTFLARLATHSAATAAKGPVRRNTVPTPTPRSVAIRRMPLPCARMARIAFTLAASVPSSGLRPSAMPSRRARASPASTRSRIIARSNSAKTAHAVLMLEVTDDGFDGGPSFELALDLRRDVALLAGGVDLELVIGRGVVAAIAGIGDAAIEHVADERAARHGQPTRWRPCRSHAGRPPSSAY